uniref:8.9 kDa family member n=1 Tax=Rhipicephalus zambeziensis TaxID=60191 RepID=A0A224YC39_9ACAR
MSMKRVLLELIISYFSVTIVSCTEESNRDLTFHNGRCYYKGDDMGRVTHGSRGCMATVCDAKNVRMIQYGCPPPDNFLDYEGIDEDHWPYCCY